ncbi:MAG: cell division ATP-binding protein FtsE [Hyphomicrobiales bacterium]|nr:cell division ATP-binding protein FtsE [Hyphomicrobiales bacterium]
MVRFENVCMRYATGPEILHNISLELESGSFHYLSGSSGAGKTSLLRLIFLAHRPSRGEIQLFGKNTSSLERASLPALRRKIGVVFQDFRLFPHLNIYENVALPLHIAGEQESAYRSGVLELLDWVGLNHRLDATPPLLSGGEKQRAAIARAVVARPRLIVADEPTGNVDPDMAARLMRLLVELNRHGTTILVATHDHNLWDSFPKPRLHLDKGYLQPELDL